ncbi:uncharacterized protein O3C94_010623 [Discoglossus pictus]
MIVCFIALAYSQHASTSGQLYDHTKNKLKAPPARKMDRLNVREAEYEGKKEFSCFERTTMSDIYLKPTPSKLPETKNITGRSDADTDTKHFPEWREDDRRVAKFLSETKLYEVKEKTYKTKRNASPPEQIVTTSLEAKTLLRVLTDADKLCDKVTNMHGTETETKPTSETNNKWEKEDQKLMRAITPDELDEMEILNSSCETKDDAEEIQKTVDLERDGKELMRVLSAEKPFISVAEKTTEKVTNPKKETTQKQLHKKDITSPEQDKEITKSSGAAVHKSRKNEDIELGRAASVDYMSSQNLQKNKESESMNNSAHKGPTEEETTKPNPSTPENMERNWLVSEKPFSSVADAQKRDNVKTSKKKISQLLKKDISVFKRIDELEEMTGARLAESWKHEEIELGRAVSTESIAPQNNFTSFAESQKTADKLKVPEKKSKQSLLHKKEISKMEEYWKNEEIELGRVVSSHNIKLQNLPETKEKGSLNYYAEKEQIAQETVTLNPTVQKVTEVPKTKSPTLKQDNEKKGTTYSKLERSWSIEEIELGRAFTRQNLPETKDTGTTDHKKDPTLQDMIKHGILSARGNMENWLMAEKLLKAETETKSPGSKVKTSWKNEADLERTVSAHNVEWKNAS